MYGDEMTILSWGWNYYPFSLCKMYGDEMTILFSLYLEWGRNDSWGRNDFPLPLYGDEMTILLSLRGSCKKFCHKVIFFYFYKYDFNVWYIVKKRNLRRIQWCITQCETFFISLCKVTFHAGQSYILAIFATKI